MENAKRYQWIVFQRKFLHIICRFKIKIVSFHANKLEVLCDNGSAYDRRFVAFWGLCRSQTYKNCSKNFVIC